MAPFSPENDTSGPASIAQPDRDRALPVASGPLHSPPTNGGAQGKRISFWRRISMRRRNVRDAGHLGTEGQQSILEDRPGSDLQTRLTILERRLDLREDSHREQLRQIERRLDEVWEVEEQLSHLIEIQDKLDQITHGQMQIAGAITANTRRTTWITIGAVAVLGAAIALFLRVIPIAW